MTAGTPPPSDPDTSLIPFSAGYVATEFTVIRSEAVSGVTMCSHRADDIRAWWTAADLPVVLRADARHLVAAESGDIGYDNLLVPDYLSVDEGVHLTLIPSESHTRLVTGFGGQDE